MSRKESRLREHLMLESNEKILVDQWKYMIAQFLLDGTRFVAGRLWDGGV